VKKTIFRILAIILTASIFISLAAGCRSNEDGADFIFLPEFVTLPDTISDVGNLTYSNGMLFFTSGISVNDSWTVKLYSMNLDGTNVSELENYVPLSHPNPNATGYVYIGAITADPDGGIWVSEGAHFQIDNTPEGFEGDWEERYQYIEDLGSQSQLRKLDNTGAEVLSLNVENLVTGEAQINQGAFAIDGSGNLYIGTQLVTQTDFDWSVDEIVLVLNNNGEFLFEVEVPDFQWISGLVRLIDGSVACMGYMQSMERGYTQALRKIDFDTRAMGETIELPENIYAHLIPGGGDYLMFYQDGRNLFGIHKETNEPVKLINWIDSGILPEMLDNILILPDGQIICINRRSRNTASGWEMITDLIIFTKTPISQLPERIELTLAVMYVWELREAIVEFNKTNQRYRIKVNDYSEFNNEDDWNAGMTRLSTDIISGNIPDMLVLEGLPFHQYVARDLLVDIYPLIDSDPELNRSDFIESVLKATEINGGLYRIFTSFAVNTLVGNPAVVGPYPGWNMLEFRDVLDANPRADMPLGMHLTRDSFVMSNIILNLDEYINWATGEVNFDTPDFAMLLEFSKRFPGEINYDDDSIWERSRPEVLIPEGRQILNHAWVGNFAEIREHKRLFGGDIVFKGFPSENRDGNSLNINTSLAITSTCSDIDGAWEFMRTFLSRNWQRENISWMFPTNKSVFDEMAVDAMNEPDDMYGGFGIARSVAPMPDMPGFEPVPQEPLTQADIDQVIALIESVSGVVNYEQRLIDIIQEGIGDYFSGRNTAQDTARILQSRVGIYIAEQS